MNGMTPLAGDIEQRLSELKDAEKALADQIAVAQSKCAHAIVAHLDYQGRGCPPRRICLACRLETEGSHWSSVRNWSDRDHMRDPELGNDPSRLVVPVDRSDDFYKLRLPGQPIHPRRRADT